MRTEEIARVLAETKPHPTLSSLGERSVWASIVNRFREQLIANGCGKDLDLTFTKITLGAS